MQPKSNRHEVFNVVSGCLLIASVLTALVFVNPASSFLSTALFIVLPTGALCLMILLYALKRFSSKARENAKERWRFFIFLDLVAHELIPNRLSLIIILFLLALFIGMGQAEELLLHLSDQKMAPPFFFALLMLLALTSWYATRFMYLQNIVPFQFKQFFTANFKEHLTHKNPNIVHVRGVLPKILGLIIILIPTLFILKLYLSNVNGKRDVLVIIATGVMFWILAIIVYAFSRVRFYEIIKNWLHARRWIIWIILSLFIALTLSLFFSKNMDSPQKIPWLYFSGLAVAIMYFLITSLEVEKVLLARHQQAKNSVKLGTFFGSVLISIFFIAFNIFPRAFTTNGLTILLAGLIFYSFVAYFLIIWGGKIKIPVLTLLIVIGAAVSMKFSPKTGLHDVRLTPNASQYNVNNRVDMDTYVASWFKHNQHWIESYHAQHKKFPILFVSAEGGGSRAALWTLLTHNALENYIPNYYQHIFSMSGASGGNTGNSFYLAFQETRDPKNKSDIGQMACEVFQSDFVSTDIGMLFGRDAWQSLFCSSLFADRSEILQQKWEHRFAEATKANFTNGINPLNQEFLSFWYEPNKTNLKDALRFKHPLFILNTTHVQSGDHATLSAVKLQNFIPQNMDLLSEVYEKHNQKSIPLSSGALMNARFPVICPSGKIEGVGNFVDAGYADNIGGAETRAVIQAVIRYMDKNHLNKDSFNLVHLVFRNGLPDSERNSYIAVRTNKTDTLGNWIKQEPYAYYTSPSEALVPAIGLVNAAFAHPNKELAEIQFIVDTTLYFDLKRTRIRLNDDDTTTVTPILPLSRHLSRLAVRSMKACINEVMDAKMQQSLDALFYLNKSGSD